MLVIYLSLSALLVLLFVIFSPGFLFCEDTPRKADAVVLFVGPGNESRLDEARQLIREGYARYLIIPNHEEVFGLNKQGELEQLSGIIPHRKQVRSVILAARYKKYFENTHVEALEARRMMDERGIKSAMLVSSGYHMRRIRMISGRVFDSQKYAISYNPARWQAPFDAADWLDRDRRKIIGSEYVKIGWFLLYGVFGS